MIPGRTERQRREALDRANEIRSIRAVLKVQLRTGRVTVAEVLSSEEDWLATMRVQTVLLASPKLGRVKVDRLLNTCSISPSKTIAGLTERQRVCLLEHLAERYPSAVAA